MQRTIRVAKAEHQGGLRTITGYADDGAVGRALPFYLDPLALPWRVWTVVAFGDDPFQARHER